MPDTNTPLLDLLLQATGGNDNTWGENLNDSVITPIENAIAGLAEHTVTGGSLDLSADPLIHAIQQFNGTLTSDQTVIVPNLSKTWLVHNNTLGSFGLLFKTSSGTAINAPRGKHTLIRCNGDSGVYRLDGDEVGNIVDHGGVSEPAGAMECAGTAVSRASYPDLFNALCIQRSGARTSGLATITGLSATSDIKAGMPVSGTGIPSSTTVLSVDSSSQITLSQNATSSGTSTVVIAPWGVGDGSTTFNLPNFSSSGRYRRSRTSSLRIGLYQAEEVGTHNHTASASVTVTVNSGGSHSHTGTTDSGGVHTHTTSIRAGTVNVDTGVAQSTQGGSIDNVSTTQHNGHTHTFTTSTVSNHDHTASGSATITVNNNSGSETRPVTAVVMSCIKY